MRCKTFLPMTAVLVMLLVICLPMVQAQTAATAVLVSSQLPVASTYAEGLYERYAAGTAGKISFSVETAGNGRMADLAGTRISSLVSVPAYRIVSDQYGSELNDPRFVLPDNPSYGLREMNYKVDRFAGDGFPMQFGWYRRLVITDTIGGDIRSHEAIEFCWAELNHCVVLDPVVAFAE